MNANLYASFQARFKAAPKQPGLLTPEQKSISYGELDHWAACFATALQDNGVQPGDRVVAQTEKSTAAVALYLGCLRSGAVYVPLNTAYTAAEVEYFLSDAKPALLVCRPQDIDMMTQLAAKCGHPKVTTLGANGDGRLDKAVREAPPTDTIAAVKGGALASLIYTSGTTGRSKGAMLTHANLRSNALTLHEFWGWQAGDVLLHALPIFHVHGLFVALHTALLNTSTIVFLPRFDADEVVKLLPAVTVMMGVPTFYSRLLDCKNFNHDSCARMRLFISGSAPLSATTFETFAERTGHQILERYGMTEAGMITSNPLDGARVAGTVGHALPGVEVRVCDENGTVMKNGDIGTVEVKGPNVFKGYWGMPEKTAAEFRDDGFFITGDLGTLDDHGRLTIVGRGKDLIISGGYNIYPKEIESCLDTLPGISETAVIGVPHADFGEAVVAVIVVSDTASVNETAMQTMLDKNLARFKHPKQFFYLDALPRNAMGKVQKNELRLKYADTFQRT